MTYYKQRLLASTPITRSDKAILFDLLHKNSQEYKDREESRIKLTEYFTELYNKYLIPIDLVEDVKKSVKGFIYLSYNFALSGKELFDMDDFYKPDDAAKFTIRTDYVISLEDPIIDVSFIYAGDKKGFNINKLLRKKLKKEELNILKNLYCNLIENEWRADNYLKEYRGYECFPDIKTWDHLYKFNPEWYDLLYNHLTYYGSKKINVDDCDLLSKTQFDREINEAENIDVLMKKVFNYINE